ncbi:MAG: hypothetical protein ABW275_01685 [Hansschlegelia sp.]
MATYSMHTAQKELDDLIDRSERGETIEILCPSGRVRLVAVTADEKAKLADEPTA